MICVFQKFRPEPVVWTWTMMAEERERVYLRINH